MIKVDQQMRKLSVVDIGDDTEAYDLKILTSDDGSSADENEEGEGGSEEDISEEDDSGEEDFEPDKMVFGRRKRARSTTRLGRNIRQRKRTRLDDQVEPWIDEDVENVCDGTGDGPRQI